MEALILKETDMHPSVNLDAEAGILKISGRSLPEDSKTFYQPVVEWITEYSNNNDGDLNLELHLSYFNSSSAKQLLKILYILEDRKESGKNASVDWIYDANDVMIMERGEELSQLVDVEFNIRRAN